MFRLINNQLENQKMCQRTAIRESFSTADLDHHDCLFTEDDDANADTYDDSDADAAAYGGDEL